MAHLDEVIVKVDDTLAEGVIAHMNELLIALSDDAQLSREERYIQQQRLRTAIAHHGRQHQEEQDARREQLTSSEDALRTGVWPPARRPPPASPPRITVRSAPAPARRGRELNP